METVDLTENAAFGLDPSHILYAAIGASLLFAYWLPRLAFRRPPSASALLIGFGMLGSILFPDIFSGLDPTTNPGVWEVTAEIVVIVVLFATGLRIDELGGWRLWRPTVGLLAVTMPLTIAAVALLGWAMTGLTVAGAILLGAVLAPTDPVLAGDVQVGPPLEGREHPVRFGLTTEAATGWPSRSSISRSTSPPAVLTPARWPPGWLGTCSTGSQSAPPWVRPSAGASAESCSCSRPGTRTVAAT